MTTIKDIGKKILERNPVKTVRQVSEKSYFHDPVSGVLNYHTFIDFSTDLDLADALKEYLGEYNLTVNDYADMAKLSFELREQRNKAEDNGDLSEFIYIMH